ncbi:MAG: anthranilate synthase component I, partial [Alphaproteobacteria bacterium]|nr:anthranilate synthase component I [Alphaproteobacteria bacterium]
MPISPSYDSFASAYERGEAQIVSTRLVADLETPVSAMLKLTRNARYSFLLESVEGGAVRGRYSILGMNPDLIWKVEGGRALLNRRAGVDPDGPFEEAGLAPLAALRALLAESRIKLAEDAPPMAAGVFGYMGYDMVRQMEELPPPNRDALGLPDCMMIRPTVMAIFDSVRDEVTVTSPVYPAKGVSARAAYARAQERVNEVVDALDRPLDHLAQRGEDVPPIAAPRSNTTPDDYRAMVLKAKDYIAAGDIFQVVLSQRFETDFNLPPFALYRSLRRVNPSPFL